ncbi:MAG TPA: hypothetical protein VGQ56_00405 [Gemmatimonadaceae bacterium]|jgi:hypothetical protein|nr:hypothetical protein [Gemmatimonadaceae bacterium]
MTTSKKNETIRIELTSAQSEQIKAETGRSVTTIELTLQELEARITPFGSFTRLAGNHNETLLAE